jgi:hypothetical protein
MNEKSQILVNRFIDGEKQLLSKLIEIHSKLTDNDCSVYDLYLKAFFNDDMNETLIQKKNILQQITPTKKNKPSWEKKSKFEKKRSANVI